MSGHSDTLAVSWIVCWITRLHANCTSSRMMGKNSNGSIEPSRWVQASVSPRAGQIKLGKWRGNHQCVGRTLWPTLRASTMHTQRIELWSKLQYRPSCRVLGQHYLLRFKACTVRVMHVQESALLRIITTPAHEVLLVSKSLGIYPESNLSFRRSCVVGTMTILASNNAMDVPGP